MKALQTIYSAKENKYIVNVKCECGNSFKRFDTELQARKFSVNLNEYGFYSRSDLV